MYLGMEVTFKRAIRNPFKFSSDPLFNKKIICIYIAAQVRDVVIHVRVHFQRSTVYCSLEDNSHLAFIIFFTSVHSPNLF